MSLAEILLTWAMWYILIAAGFGIWMYVALDGQEVTDEKGDPMSNAFFITVALWPYSIYLLFKEWNKHD